MSWTRTLSLLSLAVFLGACNVAAAQELETREAMEVAREWLDLVDGGRYGEAWTASGATFRAAVEREKWEIAATQARNAAGALVARKLRTASSTKVIPGVPEGEYIVIQYDTRFDKLPLASETLTTEREKDGRWRVVGYWIR